MRLWVAEKPKVAAAIAGELASRPVREAGFFRAGDDLVTWCYGHLLEPAPPEAYDPALARWSLEALPILPGEWRLLPRDGAKDQLAVLEQLLPQAGEIIHAGDPDAEGQLLVDEVLEHFRADAPVRRLWLSANDSDSIRAAIARLRPNSDFQGLRESARARQRADWLIGMNLSRAFTLHARRAGADVLLSVGRVQTPTLALVVARDRAIEAFRAEPYFVLSVEVEHAQGRFRARWKAREGMPGLDGAGRLVDRELAARLAAAASGVPGRISVASLEPKRQGPPALFNLTTLTAKASAVHGHGAGDTLAALQALYDAGHLTYPRTDSSHLPESQHGDAARILAAIGTTLPALAGAVGEADLDRKSAAYDDAKVTAHHAIVPTRKAAAAGAWSRIERDLYDLVARSFVAQFHPDHEYLAAAVELELAGETWRATGRTVTVPGWRAVVGEEPADEEKPAGDDEPAQALPPVAVGDPVRSLEAQAAQKKTKPPARFTEGTLQKAMAEIHKYVDDPEDKRVLREGDGIGTVATRAAIIGELKRKGFLDLNGKQIVSTTLGRGAIDSLPEEVKSARLTALWGRELAAIERGESDPAHFLGGQVRLVVDQVAAVAGGAAAAPAPTLFAGPECPRCGEGRLRRIRRKDQSGFFWGCSRWREGCKATFDDHDGKPAIADEASSTARSVALRTTTARGAAKPRKTTVRKGR